MWIFRFYTIFITLAAAAITFAIVPGRLDEYMPFGIFFILVGLLQISISLLVILKPSKQIFSCAFFGTILLLFLWAVSLKVAMPFGPFAGRTEELNLADSFIIFLEVISVIFFGILLWKFSPEKIQKPRRILLKVISGIILLGIITFIGAQAGIHGVPFAVNMGAGMGGVHMTMQEIPMNSLREKPGNEPIKTFTLTTKEVTISGQTVWTYNGIIPGPELRVTQGDRVKITLINRLPVATSIHWHGLRLPNAEDGVAGITQDAVPPGASYTYEFIVKDQGTYWYHSHQETFTQVDRGLYGALIVEPKEKNSQLYAHDYSAVIGTTNQQTNIHFDAKPGELVRLRLISAVGEDMTGFPELLVLRGAPYKIVALDGHDINQPQELASELLPIGTGQRYDLVFNMPSSGQVALFDLRPQTGDRVIQKHVLSLGDGSSPVLPNKNKLSMFDLTSYGMPTSDPVADRKTYDVTKDLRITSQVGFRDGTYQFVHMFNGQSSPYTDPIMVKEGQYVKLRITNQTDEYHPIHLHGHIFSVISKNGKRFTGSPIHLDSILVGPHETWEGAFLADNPGLWMVHCHVLVHAFYGLSTMVNYEGVTTPYTIGTKSGNFPE